MESKPSVREFYKGRNILVTGGSGFMGKVLIEKLLYTIPDIGNVYILIRSKRGKSIKQRWEDMQRSPVFERIKNEKKSALKKIVPIQGDVLYEDLGVSSKDMDTMSEEVSVVFHFAATLRLESPLKDSVAMNTAGTLRALNVARKFKKLDMFVHLSTAFCYPDYRVLEEKFHSPTADPHDIMRLCDFLDEKQLALLTPTLLNYHPNTYTYTKRLAESLVMDEYPELPCVIARPTIVCPSLKDPIPGWVDSLNGPVGVMLGAGKGVIRTMLCDGSLNAQVIPVDIAINGLIAIVMIEVMKKTKSEHIPIYNLNGGHLKPTTWGEVLNIGKKYAREYPLAWPLWYPNGDITTNYFLHETKRILFHLGPAYLIDFLLLITGQKRFMIRIQDRISQGLEVLQYFTTREWFFPCPNYDAIHTNLSDEDNKLFLTYVDNIDREDYMINAVEGGRQFCLKEDFTKIKYNRMYHNFLFVLDILLKIVFWCFVLSFFAAWFEPVRYVFSLGEPVVKHLPFLGPLVKSD
ncbi:putative fatty acyl-CoA reductase CG5065 [Cydia splendana]|uniref:putative fatty acyl-CoA reductase CG5065 n=1 Tax=Cydia splendana TaxID=1100963 RepID=UPI0021401E07